MDLDRMYDDSNFYFYYYIDKDFPLYREIIYPIYKAHLP